MDAWLGHRLNPWMGLVALLMVAVVGIDLRNATVLYQTRQQNEHRHLILEAIDKIEADSRDAETGQRGFLITGDARYLQPYEDALKRSDADFAGLEEALRAWHPELLRRLPAVHAALEQKLHELEQTVALRRQSGFEASREVVLTDRGRRLMEQLRAEFEDLRTTEVQAIARGNALGDRLRYWAYATSLLGGLAVLLALGGTSRLLRRRFAERLAAARNLYDEKELYRTTLGSIGDAVITTDRDGRVTFLNPVAEKLTGWTTAQASGESLQSVFRIVNEDTRESVEDPALRALREGVVVGLANHTVLLHRSGLEYRIDDSAAPIRDSLGHIRGAVLVFRDISERRQVEDALREADRRKDEFLAMLAHELRNPLAPLQNALHILRVSGSNAQTVDRVTQMMERQLDQMVRLVHDLLDVSRMTRNILPLDKDWVDVGIVIRDALEMSTPALTEARHTLTVSPPAQSLTIVADRTRLTQALSNLLSNAAKYTPPGGQVWLTARDDGDAVVFSVKDSGEGIPADMIDRVFEMFTQVQTSMERSKGGLGIGLTLVRRIVELHGGSVVATSGGANQGSEFILRLPKPTNPQPESDTPQVSPSSGTVLRLVVADDNRDSADTLTTLLRLLGHRVSTAYDGADALEQLAEIRPDAAFLDLGMPRVDGYAVARTVREAPWGHDIVLIAVTGWGQDQDKTRSAAAGFNHHLVKPLTVETLDALLPTIHTRSTASPSAADTPSPPNSPDGC